MVHNTSVKLHRLESVLFLFKYSKKNNFISRFHKTPNFARYLFFYTPKTKNKMYERIREIYKTKVLALGISFDLEFNNVFTMHGWAPELLENHFKNLVDQ